MTRINLYYSGSVGQTAIYALVESHNGSIVSTVDHCNSDGTGVACVNIPDEFVDDFTIDCDSEDSVESYHVQ